MYAAIFAGAIANLDHVLSLLGDAGYSVILAADQLNAQVMLFLESYRIEWETGLAIFGLHLLLLGYLVWKSGPRVLGGLVVLAGVGYAVDSFGNMLLTDYSLTISLYTFVGEILLIFWAPLDRAKGSSDLLEESLNDLLRHDKFQPIKI